MDKSEFLNTDNDERYELLKKQINVKEIDYDKLKKNSQNVNRIIKIIEIICIVIGLSAFFISIVSVAKYSI